MTAPHNWSACPHTKLWVTLSPPCLVFKPLWAQPCSQALLPSKIPFKIPHFPHLFLQAPQVFYLLTKILLKISFFFFPSKLHSFSQCVLTALMRFCMEIAGSWKTQPLPWREPGLCPRQP